MGLGLKDQLAPLQRERQVKICPVRDFRSLAPRFVNSDAEQGLGDKEKARSRKRCVFGGAREKITTVEIALLSPLLRLFWAAFGRCSLISHPRGDFRLKKCDLKIGDQALHPYFTRNPTAASQCRVDVT